MSRLRAGAAATLIMPSPATDSAAFAPIISNPGFGYVVVGLPQNAAFRRVGKNFIVSYLPPEADHSVPMQICLWLGPGKYYRLLTLGRSDN